MPDYAPYIQATWGDNIIPSPDPFPDFVSAPLPVSLYGDATTYFAVTFANFGDAQGTGYFYNDLKIDQNLIVRNDTPLQPGHYWHWYNESQTLGGGRHTLWQASDPENNVAEHNESNNNYARQWIWEPQILAPDSQQLRAHPPIRTAGIENLPGGVPVLQNRDGMRLPPSASGWWRGAAISSPDEGHDYDLHLYTPSTGIGDGFDNNYLASSAIGGPNTDGVISNRNTVSNNTYDVGVLNWNGAESDYSLEYRESANPLQIGETQAGTMAANQMIQIIEFQIVDDQTGIITLDLQCDTDQNVMFGAFNPEFTEGSIYDTTYNGLQSSDGRVLIQLDSPANGYYGIVFYRNAYEGTSSFNYTLKVWPPSPDLVSVTLPGSHAPLIPRNNSEIAGGNPVPAPVILDGDVQNTALYFHLANHGSISTQQFNLAFLNDGVTIFDPEWPFGDLPADPTMIHSTLASFFTIPGGRHTSGIMLDSQNSNIEIFENNNHYAEQWVWNPSQLAPEEVVQRVSPPLRSGGWDLIAEGVTIFDNVDGLRSQTFEQGPSGDDGYFGAVAILPHDDADIDLRLHEPTTGPGNGFTTNLTASNYGGSSSEFILIDFDGAHSWNQAWDAGVLQFSGESNYTLQSTRSLFINTNGMELPSTFGTYGIASDEVISLTEFTTNNFDGDVSFVLNIEHQSGNADFGVKVFSRDNSSGFYSKFQSIAMNETGGPGINKTLELTLPGSGFYGLVVYKINHNDLNESLEYNVQFLNAGLSSTPEELALPSATKIEGVYPNPFNPQTTIRLAMKQSGQASVKIYDVQGRLVRTLVEGGLSAGRHDLRWTGVDNTGRSVPSGVYFVRAVHPDGVDQQRMSLVK